MFVCQFLLFFFSLLLNQRRQWWSWRALLTIFPLTPTFCKRFFLISSKGQHHACMCVWGRAVGWPRLCWRSFSLFLQLGGGMWGPSVHCRPHCQKPRAAEWHEESDFYIWEAAELHCPFSLTQWVYAGQEAAHITRIVGHRHKKYWGFCKLIQWSHLIFRLSGVCQDALPQSSTSAVFTQLAACLHSLHDAIKGKWHCFASYKLLQPGHSK